MRLDQAPTKRYGLPTILCGELLLSGPQLKEHVLNRLGYGQSRWHSARYDAAGHAGYIAEQLAQTLDPISVRGTSIKGKIERSITSRRQLEAVLIDFWFNHFNVDTGTTDPGKLSTTIIGRGVGWHQNVAVAPHVLGNFGDMLLATAMSPSMLDYLDNRTNFKTEVVNGEQLGINENYARELLELHTIGVAGGYQESDVVGVARVLTGWSVATDAFIFRPARHDIDPKRVMGRNYPAGRYQDEGEELLDFLARHRSAARFLAGKLVARFVSDDPPTGAHEAARSTYRNGDGDLRSVMQAIFASADFLAPQHFRSKIKPPHRYCASAVLAMGARERDDFVPLLNRLAAQVIECGEKPYAVAPPTGYPERSAFWVSSSSMVTRFQMAEVIAYHPALRSRLKGWAAITGADTAETVAEVAALMVPGGLSAQTRLAVLDHVAANATTNDGRVSAAAHLILCSPEFVRY